MQSDSKHLQQAHRRTHCLTASALCALVLLTLSWKQLTYNHQDTDQTRYHGTRKERDELEPSTKSMMMMTDDSSSSNDAQSMNQAQTLDFTDAEAVFEIGHRLDEQMSLLELVDEVIHRSERSQEKLEYYLDTGYDSVNNHSVTVERQVIDFWTNTVENAGYSGGHHLPILVRTTDRMKAALVIRMSTDGMFLLSNSSKMSSLERLMEHSVSFTNHLNLDPERVLLTAHLQNIALAARRYSNTIGCALEDLTLLSSHFLFMEEEEDCAALQMLQRSSTSMAVFHMPYYVVQCERMGSRSLCKGRTGRQGVTSPMLTRLDRIACDSGIGLQKDAMHFAKLRPENVMYDKGRQVRLQVLVLVVSLSPLRSYIYPLSAVLQPEDDDAARHLPKSIVSFQELLTSLNKEQHASKLVERNLARKAAYLVHQLVTEAQAQHLVLDDHFLKYFGMFQTEWWLRSDFDVLFHSGSEDLTSVIGGEGQRAAAHQQIPLTEVFQEAISLVLEKQVGEASASGETLAKDPTFWTSIVASESVDAMSTPIAPCHNKPSPVEAQEKEWDTSLFLSQAQDVSQPRMIFSKGRVENLN